MKKSILILFLFACTSVSAQKVYDTTTVPLEGTYIENGKLRLKPGYTITLSMDKKVGTVRLADNGVASGNVVCVCPSGGGACDLVINGKSFGCDGDACCKVFLSSDRDLANAIATTGDKDGKVKWSRLIVPSAAVKTLGTTSVLPKGSSVKNSKIILDKGYAFYESADKKILTVYRMSNGAVAGSYTCMCSKKENDNCGVVLKDGVGTCGGESCCNLVVVIGATNYAQALSSGETDKPIDWKIYVAPQTGTKTTN